MADKTSIKAYMDSKNRLIVIVDNPGNGITDLIKTFLGGFLPQVQYLDAPAPMPTPEIDTAGMKELQPTAKPEKSAKFVKKSQERNVEPPKGEHTEKSADIPNPAEKTKPADIPGPVSTAAAGTDVKPPVAAKLPDKPEEEEKPGAKVSRPVVLKKPVEQMSVFELRNYLRSMRTDKKLSAVLAAMAHSTNLEYVLSVKTEREIREIARRMAG